MKIAIVQLKPVRFLKSFPFRKIASRVLGTSYELDILFAPQEFVKALNRRYRKKNQSANVLAFPLSQTQGELVFDPERIRKEAKRYGQSPKEHFASLFAHGLLHLKGYRHGVRMEKEGRKIARGVEENV